MSIESKSFESLAKKLAAVRATLNNDERAILDRVVETADLTDVAAHGFRFSAAADRPASDVEAHVLPTGPVVSDADARVSDVEAHKLPTAPVASEEGPYRFDVDAHKLPTAPIVSDAGARVSDVEAHQATSAADNARIFRFNYAKLAQKDDIDVEAHGFVRY